MEVTNIVQKLTRDVSCFDDALRRKVSGERAIFVRHLAGIFSRDDFIQLCDHAIAPNTLWRAERGGGRSLGPKTADVIVRTVRQFGVITSVAWLMTGVGEFPYVDPHLNVTAPDPITPKAMDDLSNEQDAMKILTTYSELHQHYILSTTIDDDAMSPDFHVGDIIAGKRMRHAVQLLGQVLLVELDNGRVFLRKLWQSSTLNRYDLRCINAETQSSELVMKAVKVKSIAEVELILRHRTYPA